MKKQFLLIASIILVLCATYLPNLGNSFINWDFYAYEKVLYSNKPLETSWRLLTDFRGELVSGYYGPLASISLMTDKFLVGSPVPRARVTILINLIIHGLNGVLLFFLVRAVGGNLAVCGLTVFVFLLHPVQVSSILWGVQRKTVLAGAFYLGSFLTYLRYRESGRHMQYLMGVFLFGLAVLCKPSAVTLPLALMLTDLLMVPSREAERSAVSTLFTGQSSRKSLLWFGFGSGTTAGSSVSLQRGGPSGFAVQAEFWWRTAIRMLPFFLIAIAHTLLTMKTETVRTPDLPWIDRPFVAAAAFWFYVGKILVPVDLIAVYPRWNVDVWSALWWMPPVGVLIAVISLGYWRRRVGNEILWGLGNFLLGILPVLGIVEFGYFQHSFVANHFLYMALPGIGFCLAVLFYRLCERVTAPLKYAFAALLAMYLMFITVQTYFQTEVWQNGVTLWTHTLRHNSSSWSAHHCLGTELLEKGELSSAEEHLALAAEMNPKKALVASSLGNLLVKKGDLPEAAAMYRKALALNPELADSHCHLGVVLAQQGNTEEAMQHLQEAIRLDPDHATAYCNMGWIFRKAGNIAEASKAFEKALEKEPYLAEAHINLGGILESSGRLAEALAHYEDAAKFKPENPEAHYSLGNALAKSNKLDQAIAHYERSVELKPDFGNGHNNLGVAYLRSGKFADAILHFRRALQIDPRHERAKVNLEKAERLFGSSSSGPLTNP
jgi:protein O-mannosyl-transferase